MAKCGIGVNDFMASKKPAVGMGGDGDMVPLIKPRATLVLQLEGHSRL